MIMDAVFLMSGNPKSPIFVRSLLRGYAAACQILTNRHTTMKHLFKLMIIAVFLVPAVWQHPVFSQVDSGAQILGSLNRVPAEMPQQKLFLHTDKDEYLAGETLWFKAYLVNAFSHQPDLLSTNLQVHLLNADGDLAGFALVKLTDGYGHGDFQLPDSLADGNYHILAHTDMMEAWGSDEVFKKYFYVHNPEEENFIRRRGIRSNRRLNRSLENLEENVQFAVFPEGGNMAAGLENRVAFKAADGLGRGMDASGRLRTGDGTEILTFTTIHDGMGEFAFVPEAGKEYTVQVEFADGSGIQKVLPAALEEGYVLNVLPRDGKLEVSVSANFDSRQYNIPPDIFIIAQVRGRAYFYELGMLRQGRFNTTIPADMLPTGVAQITVFDANNTPLAERLVFVNHHDIGEASIQTSTSSLGGQSAIVMDLTFDEHEFKDSKTGYSLAVLASPEGSPGYGENIATSFYLTSELGHLVNDPWYYFQDNDEARLAADLLMMTHGWRRFSWENILAGDFGDVEARREERLTISGKVTLSRYDDSPGEQTVELGLLDGQSVEIYRSTTRHTGEFSFSGLEFDELTRVRITVPASTRERRMEVELDRREYRKRPHVPGFYSQKHEILRRGRAWRRVPVPETLLPDPTRQKHTRISALGAAPDFVLYMDDVRGEPTDMASLMSGRVRISRGPASINLPTIPLFLIDGSIVKQPVFYALNPVDLEKIEVYSGASTAIFGARGANGAIHAVTRTGLNRDETMFNVTGYHIPRKFFVNHIHYSEYAALGLSKTLLWEEILVPNNNGEARYMFPGIDSFDHVRVVIQGVDNNGHIIYTEQKLR